MSKKPCADRMSCRTIGDDTKLPLPCDRVIKSRATKIVDRQSHGDSTDAEAFHEGCFGRQPFARSEPARTDQFLQPTGDLHLQRHGTVPLGLDPRQRRDLGGAHCFSLTRETY